MALRDSMVQRRKAINISSINRTFAFFQKNLDDWRRAYCSSTMKRQLAPLILDSGTAFIIEQSADCGEISFGCCEVQSVLDSLVSLFPRRSRIGLQRQMRWLGTWPVTLFTFTSAPFRRRRSIIGSPSAFFKLDAIIRGVQHDPSCLLLVGNSGRKHVWMTSVPRHLDQSPLLLQVAPRWGGGCTPLPSGWGDGHRHLSLLLVLDWPAHRIR